MIGYDRPLKPEWIYKTLQMVAPGKKPEEYYDAYNQIAVELTGKDGRRKTRTVLFRTFIYSFQEKTSVIENNILISLCKQKDYEYMKPILLSMFILHYEILKYFTQSYFKIFDPSQEVSATALTKKMTELFGDTEFAKRSTRAFFKTLSDFGIIESTGTNTFHQINKSKLTAAQVSDILKLYATVKHTKQIDIQNIDKSIFAFYDIPDLKSVASQFHNSEWEYIKGVERGLLMLH